MALQSKISVLVACLGLFMGNLQAQETAAPATKNRYNVLKTNILSPVSLGFERGLGKHFSLGVNGLYFPSISYGQASDAYGHVDLADPSTGFTAEARFYTSKTKAPLNGFFVGAFYTFRIVDVKMHKTATSGTTTADLKITIPSDLTMYGLMIGSQRIRAKGFTTDFNIGAGYYEVGNIPQIASDANESFKALSRISKLSKGIGPRMSFSLGYAF
jgi:Protein of unknown function (DUF3575)